jgi:hypothetical protein
MSQDHTRAERLIVQDRIEGISAADQQWLQQHLAECVNCAANAGATDRTIGSLRGLSIALPPALVSRTQFRVRIRAEQLRREPRWRMVWAACGISWLFGAGTAPYVWHGLEWVGHRLGVPNIVWELGFGLWWALPAAVVAVILLMTDAGHNNEADWNRQAN